LVAYSNRPYQSFNISLTLFSIYNAISENWEFLARNGKRWWLEIDVPVEREFFSFLLFFFYGTLTLLCFDVWALIWKDAKRVEYQWEFVFDEIEHSHSTLSHNRSCLQR
jgi:hypothetical protein